MCLEVLKDKELSPCTKLCLSYTYKIGYTGETPDLFIVTYLKITISDTMLAQRNPQGGKTEKDH